MNELIISKNEISTAAMLHWAQFVDASEKTVETYTKAIKRFAAYASERGITQPQRAGRGGGNSGNLAHIPGLDCRNAAPGSAANGNRTVF